MVDKAGIDEFTMEKKIVEKENVDEKYVKIALSKVLNQTYLAINGDSQYVYFRNYMKRIVKYLFTLDFPENYAQQLPSFLDPNLRQKRE